MKMQKNEIIKNVYNGDVLLIPKHLYVNKEGVIINSNAPIPSNISAIERMILEH